MITAEGLAARLGALGEVGVRPDGVWRLAWTEEDAATRAWFEQQAAGTGLRAARDPAGNLWACPDADPPWWGVGSHLDSVRGGGRFDGPLGVAVGFEIAAASSRPVAVISFADEEGARFNTPTFGSKALAGRLDLPAVLRRRDDDGVPLLEAMGAAGADPAAIADAPRWLDRLAGFIEVHIDQTTELARAGVPVGVVSSLAARTRLEVVLSGRADHAGTTPRSERRDALAAAARLIVGAEDLAGADAVREGSAAPDGGAVALDGDHAALTVTASRIITKPNAPTTIASEVHLWIDARAPSFAAIDAWRMRLDALVGELRERSGVGIDVAVASRSDPREFSEELRAALSHASEQVLGHTAPEVVCFAGHDAGVLAERVPAAMLLVRNPTGISHSPAETVELEDAAIAAVVVERALELVG
ncbi:MAG TPA: hydantoinase/carbamoylase family amidase [Solirubrobacteraceae bacterium]|nr:hydantoinase/carbamoylase family amidase [Solirubrobacteraceae bacterium]